MVAAKHESLASNYSSQELFIPTSQIGNLRKKVVSNQPVLT